MKYDLENYIYYDKDLEIYDYLHTDSQKFIKDLRAIDFQSTVVKGNREIDEIALQFYETELLWWVLALYNDIRDLLEYPPEYTLYIPAKADLEKLFLNYQED